MAIQSYSYSGRGSERTAYRIIFFGQSNRIGFHYILSHFFLTLWFYKTPHMTSKVTPLSQQSKIPNPTQPNPTALSRHSSPARPPPESPSPDRRRVRVPTGGFSPCITMGSDFKAIPLIDISPLVGKIDYPSMVNDEDLLQVVQMLDDACREAGFFYVKGHGIADSLMKQVRDVTQKFFQLPYEEKLKIKMTPQSGYRGYQRVGENITKGKPDMHEAIDCYTPIEPGKYGDLAKPMVGSNLWPKYPSNFDVLLENYISRLRDLSRKIMRGIALALGAPVDAFEGTTAGDPFWVCRLIGYPVSTDIPEEQRTDTGCGAHTDYGLLTLVNQDDDICALEVRNQSGEWIYAKPIPGTFVCNIGDMLKVWSNGIYQPTLHRVVNNSPRYRVSVAFFYESNFDAAVEPVEFCRERTGGVAKYEKVVYGEHLVQKVLTNFVM
uniref:Fe2OG dioxygenase domain-containing protein n=1 Tax=Oryza rufipogon TaxID=4529 RepID=A0A0E0QNF6_ORYRU